MERANRQERYGYRPGKDRDGIGGAVDQRPSNEFCIECLTGNDLHLLYGK